MKKEIDNIFAGIQDERMELSQNTLNFIHSLPQKCERVQTTHSNTIFSDRKKVKKYAWTGGGVLSFVTAFVLIFAFVIMPLLSSDTPIIPSGPAISSLSTYHSTLMGYNDAVNSLAATERLSPSNAAPSQSSSASNVPALEKYNFSIEVKSTIEAPSSVLEYNELFVVDRNSLHFTRSRLITSEYIPPNNAWLNTEEHHHHASDGVTIFSKVENSMGEFESFRFRYYKEEFEPPMAGLMEYLAVLLDESVYNLREESGLRIYELKSELVPIENGSNEVMFSEIIIDEEVLTLSVDSVSSSGNIVKETFIISIGNKTVDFPDEMLDRINNTTWRDLPAPTNVRFDAETSTLTWDAMPGVLRYEIWIYVRELNIAWEIYYFDIKPEYTFSRLGLPGQAYFGGMLELILDGVEFELSVQAIYPDVVRYSERIPAIFGASFWDTDVEVSLEKHGGVGVADSMIFEFGNTYWRLPELTKDGYIFCGWWTGEHGTDTQVTRGTPVSTKEPHTLYAKWVPSVNPWWLLIDDFPNGELIPDSDPRVTWRLRWEDIDKFDEICAILTAKGYVLTLEWFGEGFQSTVWQQPGTEIIVMGIGGGYFGSNGGGPLMSGHVTYINEDSYVRFIRFSLPWSVVDEWLGI
jgi:uncharacterized repeat protein (TIGR02543 family)